MIQNLEEKVISEKIVYEGFFNMAMQEVELPDGRRATREFLKHPGGVGIVALTDKDELIMVRQWRAAIGQLLLEIPAGKLDPGEAPEVCGRRELEEETGYSAGSFQPLGSFVPSCGCLDEIHYLFLATDLKPGEKHTDADEFVSVEKIPLNDLYEMLQEGTLIDGKSVIALYRVLDLKQRGVI